MDEWVLERIEGWDSDAFEGGIEGLTGLAEQGFSGAIVSDGLRVLLVNGKAVLVDGGSITEANGDGRVYRAPDPAVPLLFAMTESSEQIDRGFTDDESFDSVHETMAARGFSGYLRLSEYVLSGDYYVVYYGEEALPVAFVGSSNRLRTGDEALSLAAEEVGIYEVHRASVSVESIPESA